MRYIYISPSSMFILFSFLVFVISAYLRIPLSLPAVICPSLSAGPYFTLCWSHPSEHLLYQIIFFLYFLLLFTFLEIKLLIEKNTSCMQSSKRILIVARWIKCGSCPQKRKHPQWLPLFLWNVSCLLSTESSVLGDNDILIVTDNTFTLASFFFFLQALS